MQAGMCFDLTVFFDSSALLDLANMNLVYIARSSLLAGRGVC